MMWPRSPMTWTLSAPCVYSKTVAPPTFVRFALPSDRIVAMRTAALNFSVTMSRCTGSPAHEGVYITICGPASTRDSITLIARVRARMRAVRAVRLRRSEEFRDVGGVVRDGHTGGLERVELRFRGAAAFLDDRAGLAPPPPPRGGRPLPPPGPRRSPRRGRSAS